MDMTMLELGDILPNASVMIVSVTGSTTSGQPLSEADLADCFRACDEGKYIHCNVLFAPMPFFNLPCIILTMFAPVLLLLLFLLTIMTMIVLKLDEDKASILKFVESRMSYIAPNLSHMIGNNPHHATKSCSLHPMCDALPSNVDHPLHLLFSRMFSQVPE